jgi:hypothetical protein
MREGPLHAALKAWYAASGDAIEVPIDGFVVDIVRGDLLIEIQTAGFSALRRKLDHLLPDHPVRIVHPIAADKWIVKRDGSAEIGRRRSPKHGTAVDVFSELTSFPERVAHPHLTIDVLLVSEEEVWRPDDSRGWRRRGWVIEERRLLDVVDHLAIDGPGDLASLLPGGLSEPFTTGDLATALGKPRRLAQQMAYCLARCGVLEAAGKAGNANLYRVPGRPRGLETSGHPRLSDTRETT